MATKNPENNKSAIHSVLDKPEIQQKIQQDPTESNIVDRHCESVVLALSNAGMKPKTIAASINATGFYKDTWTASDAVLILNRLIDKKLDSFGLSLTQLVRDFIATTEGEFSLRDVAENLGILKNKPERNKLSTIMCRMVDENIVERTGKRNGVFRRIETDLDEMNFVTASEESADIWLPFGLHKIIETNYSNILIIMGEPNAGKTALCLNLIRYNMLRFDTHYFNSEMGPTELKKRLLHFDDIPIADWKFRAYERSTNFEDVIVPGKGKLNIIDFLEIHDEFWKIGGILSKIHAKLKGSIAVICIQKDRGTDIGRGGITTLEKPRLALAIKPGEVKIVKAKNWKTRDNPNGRIVKYKLRAGCWFEQIGEWMKVAK